MLTAAFFHPIRKGFLYLWLCTALLAGSLAAAQPAAAQTAPLSGTYAVGGSGADFADFGAAAQALDTRGVDGAVVFEVADGTYSESVVIAAISGASATNTITFRSAGGDSSAVVLEASGDQGDEPLRLDGTDHVRFEHLTLRLTGTSSADSTRVTTLSGTLEDVHFTEVQVLGPPSSTLSAGFFGVVAEAGSSGSSTTTIDLLVERSRFGRVVSGLYLEGHASAPSTGTVVRDNVIEGTAGGFLSDNSYAVYLRAHDGARVEENTIRRFGTGITIEASAGSPRVLRNDLSDISGGGFFSSSLSAGIVLHQAESPSGDTGLVANNEITSSTTGIYVDGSSHQRIFHNTVNASGNAHALTLAGDSSDVIVIKNNILAAEDGLALRALRTTGQVLDYNDLYNLGYTSSDWLVYWGFDRYSDLSSYQSASGQGANSVSAEPLFASDTDLTPSSRFLDDEGTDLTDVVPTDIHGTTRTPPVSIGAVEYSVSQPPLSAGTYTIGGSGADYTDFGAAVQALATRGIDGAVVFEVADGTYAESVTLEGVEGRSATSTITFRSASGDSSAVVLEAGGAEGDEPLRLVDADHVRFERLTLRATNTTDDAPVRAAVLTGTLTDVRFTGMQFLGYDGSSEEEHVGLYAWQDPAAFERPTTSELVVEGSRFGASASGVYLSGDSQDRSAGTVIRGNVFGDQQLAGPGTWGVYLSAHDGVQVIGNVVTGGEQGIMVNFSSGAIEVARNEIDVAAMGIELQSSSGAADDPGLVANNEITISGNYTTTGLVVSSSDHQQIYHNSVNMTDEGTAFHGSLSSGTEVMNNVFASAGGPALDLQRPDLMLDHNDLYTTGSVLVQYQDDDFNVTEYASLAGYQSGAGQGANSVSVDPLFASDTDLTPSGAALAEGGTDLTGMVPADLHGSTRTPPVSIGAVEVAASTVQVTVQLDARRLERLGLLDRSTGAAFVEVFDGSYPTQEYLRDPNGDSTWTTAVSLLPGETVNYAFGIDPRTGAGFPNDRVLELSGDASGARVLTVPSSATTLASVSFDDEPLVPVELDPAVWGSERFEGGDPFDETFADSMLLTLDLSALGRRMLASARRYETDPGGSAPSGIAVVAPQGYWGIGHASTKTSYDATLTFDYGPLSGIRNPNHLRLLRRSSADEAWQVVSADVDQSAEALTATGLSDIGGEWALGSTSDENPLTQIVPQVVSAPNPPDGGVVTSTEATLVGQPAPDAHHYDLYLWEASGSDGASSEVAAASLPDSKPSSPTIRNQEEPRFEWSSLEFGTTYKWQVVAKNVYGTTAGPVWTFAVHEAPDLTVSDIVVPDEGFSGQSITVDWRVSNAGNAGTNVPKWIDGVYLSPDETLDPDDDWKLGTTENVSYLGEGEQYAGQAELTLPRGISGPHRLFVRADVDGSMEEADETNNLARVALDVTRSPHADLEVTDLSMPSTAFSGDSVRVQWTVTNTGTAAADVPLWLDGVFLSDEDELDVTFIGSGRIRVGASLLREVEHSGRLAPDSSSTVSVEVPLPIDSVGSYHLFAYVDMPEHVMLARSPEGAVYEFDQELDNWAGDSIEIRLTPPPDLTVTDVEAPAGVESGETIDLSWTVANRGAGSVPVGSSTWNDAVYLSSSPSFDSSTVRRLNVVTHTAHLESDEASGTTASVTLPDSVRGEVYFAVVTDWDDDVFEHTFEDNNQAVASAATSVTRAPYPDLQVAGLSLSTSEATAGRQIVARYEVQNHGTAAAEQWSDSLYISTDDTFDPSSARRLAAAPSSDPLAAGTSRERRVTVRLPADLPSGQYHLYVRADARDRAYEYPDTTGNVSRSGELDVAAYPPVDLSLAIENLPDTAAAGATITPRFVTTNAGTGRTLASAWTDEYYLSRDGTIDDDDTRLATTAREAALDGGASYERTPSLAIPHGIEGSYRLLAVTDASDAVAEVDTTNNLAAPELTVQRPPPADLRVNAIDAPAADTSGQTMTVEWTVENAGTGPTRAGAWYDAVYLSRDLRVSDGDIRLGTVERDGDLAAGGTYRGTLDADVPVFASGTFYVLVRTDERDDAYEHEAEANNVGSVRIELMLQAPSDLVVASIEAPSGAEAGRDVTVRWTLENQGPNAAEGTVREGVFVSEDEAWDVEDPLLGIVERSVSIDPGATQERQAQVDLATAYKAAADGTITGSLPGIPPGDYHVIVRTDIADNIRETDEENNRRTYAEQLTASMPSFALGSSAAFTRDEAGDRYYRVDVASDGHDLSFELSADAADAAVKLYVRRGAVPTPNTYDAKADAPFEAAQSIVLPAADAGTYYLLARAESVPASGTSFELSAEALSFEVRRAEPARGGNGGVVTTAVMGAQFEPGARLFLQADDGTRFELQDSTYVPGSTRLHAPLDLRGQAPGTYDLVVQNPGGTETVATDAFTVEASQGAEPYVQYRKPTAVRSGTSLNVGITVGNRGNEDAVDVYLLVGVRGYRGLDPEPVELSDLHPYLFPDDTSSAPGTRPQETRLYPFWFSSIPPGQEMTFQLLVDHQIPQGAITFAHAFGLMPASDFSASAALEDLESSVGLRFMADALVTLMEEEATSSTTGAVTTASQTMKTPTVDEATAEIWKGVTELATEVRAPIPGTNEILSGPVARSLKLRRTQREIRRTGTVEDRVVDGMIDDAAEASDAAAGGGPAGGALYDARETFSGLIESVFDGLEAAAPSGEGDEADGGGDGGGGGDGPPDPGCERCFPLPDPEEPTDVEESEDPNDILGPDGHGQKGWVAVDQSLDYTIRFENDPEHATAPAQVVEIRHPLDEDVDERAFELGRFGFANLTFEVPANQASYSTRLDVRDSLGIFVDVTAGLDVQAREAFWRFTTIDPATGSQPSSDPTTGLLPVNDTTGRGEGFARYRIRPNPAAQTGDEIEARAEIVFDTNPPIETPVVVNTIDAVLPTSRLQAEAGSADTSGFVMRWSGSDTGAGLARYALYVSVDGGPFALHEAGLTDTSHTFTGEQGHEYAFFARAVDHAGNREARKDSAEAVTFTGQSVAVRPGDTNHDGVVDQTDVLPIGTYFGKTGPARSGTSSGWTDQTAPVWSPPEATYVDADGDGLIDQRDLLPIGNNFGRTHSVSKTPARASEHARIEIPPLPVGRTFPVHLAAGSEKEAVEELMGAGGALQLPNVFEVVSVAATEALDDGDLLAFRRHGESAGRLSFAFTRKSTGEPLAAKGAPLITVTLRVGTPMVNSAGIALFEPAVNTADTLLVGEASQATLGSPEAAALPDEFVLEQNYPNPFNPTTAFRYGVPEAQDVTIEVFDVIGRRVNILVDETKEAGWYQEVFDAGHLASGVYFYRLHADETLITRKMVLVK